MRADCSPLAGQQAPLLRPAGCTITPERRAAVYRLAQRYGLLIVEDDPYCYIRYPAGPGGHWMLEYSFLGGVGCCSLWRTSNPYCYIRYPGGPGGLWMLRYSFLWVFWVWFKSRCSFGKTTRNATSAARRHWCGAVCPPCLTEAGHYACSDYSCMLPPSAVPRVWLRRSPHRLLGPATRQLWLTL